MAKKTNSAKQTGSRWLYGFGGIFLVIGLLTLVSGLKPVWQSMMAKDWVQVEASIVELEQVISHGEDSISYGVKGRFEYQYQGNSYRSRQFDFSGGTDNIGDYQRQFYSRLKQARSRNQMVSAWVNPTNPAKAVVNREIRFGLLAFQSIFGLVFAAAGVGILFLARYTNTTTKEQSTYQQQFPDQPWRWRKEWQDDTLTSNASLGFYAMGFFALIWNLISLPIAGIVFLGSEAHPLGVKLIILIFPLAGMFLLYLAYKAYISMKKYGNATLVMHTMPFEIGGESSGEICIPGMIAGEHCLLTLSCIKKTRRKSGKSSRTDEDILWQGDQRVVARPSTDGSGKLEYRFDIPGNLPENGKQGKRTSVDWQLDIKAEENSTLNLQFTVPAFVTGNPPGKSNDQTDTSADHAPVWKEDTLQSQAQSFSSTTGDWSRLGIEQSWQRGGTHYYFPACRNLKMTLGFPIFGLVFFGIGVFLHSENAGWLFTVVFGGIGLLCLVLGLRMLFYRSEVRIANRTVYVRRGVLRLSDKEEFTAADISKFTISSNMRSGNTRVYRLDAQLLNEDKVLLGKNLLVKSDVESLVNQFKQHLGMAI